MTRHKLIGFSIIDKKRVAFQTALQHFLTQNAMKFNVKSTNVNKRTKTKLAPE